MTALPSWGNLHCTVASKIYGKGNYSLLCLCFPMENSFTFSPAKIVSISPVSRAAGNQLSQSTLCNFLAWVIIVHETYTAHRTLPLCAERKLCSLSCSKREGGFLCPIKTCFMHGYWQTLFPLERKDRICSILSMSGRLSLRRKLSITLIFLHSAISLALALEECSTAKAPVQNWTN